ncbi:MAG TPA: alpha/beta hydrolase [Streptosporangiaceae bacterium]|nr:alpha/beta hydrolase [Streptosporangiaceae bacterium]
MRSAPSAGPVAEPAVYVHGLGGSATNWTDLMALLGGHPATAGPECATAAPDGATAALDGAIAAPDGATAPPDCDVHHSGIPARSPDDAGSGILLDGEAVDLPGFGFSPPPPDGDYSISGHARSVARLIDRRGRGPVHLFGNSLGGAVCTRLAARRPDLVRTLTLISPALPDLRPRSATLSFPLLLVPGLGDRLISQLRLRPVPARVAATADLVYFDPLRIHPQRHGEEIAELARRDGLEYAAAVVLGSARAVVREYFRVGSRSLWCDAMQVSAPVLAIFGSHDRMVGHGQARRATRRFPVGRSVVLLRTGHVAQMETPAAVAREVRTFLRDYAGRSVSEARDGLAEPGLR